MIAINAFPTLTFVSNGTLHCQDRLFQWPAFYLPASALTDSLAGESSDDLLGSPLDSAMTRLVPRQCLYGSTGVDQDPRTV